MSQPAFEINLPELSSKLNECTAECNLPSGLFATSVKGLALVLLFVFFVGSGG